MNAFVEIVFDNSDQRFLNDSTSDEVVLRRTIGLKKDEFFLQRSRTTKQEVQSLLEGAGFSKSNPYYIVQQGKVQDLCTMSEEARLRLLMEVAGTTVYDEKKAESLVKMAENRSSIEKIADILRDIQARLDELQAEKEELSQYQTLDRQRRALEYSLYDKEWQRARHLLEQLEQDRAQHTQELSQLDDQAKSLHDQIRHATALWQERTVARQRNHRQVNHHAEDLRTLVQELAKKELAVTALQESLQAAQTEQQAAQQQLAALADEITRSEATLAETTEPAWQTAVQALETTKTEKAAVDQKIKGLYAKQGRGRHFDTVEARDAFLQDRIAELETQRQTLAAQVATEQERLAHLRRSLDDGSQQAAAAQLAQHVKDSAALGKTLEDTLKARTACQEERKQAWRQREVLNDQVRDAMDARRRAKEDLNKTTPRATALGLDALSTIVEQEGLRHGHEYFGPVMENFELRDPKYQTAVEVAAQNALFHVIVDTDETASRLMRRLQDGRLGRVTFLPLNQLRIDTEDKLPTNHSEVRPLLQHCLKYDSRVERALKHVFGKKLLCKDLDLATEWSAKLGVDGITLEGDLCSRKGSLTGGYIDTAKSRLRAMFALKQAQAQLDELQEKNAQVEKEATATDNKLNSLQQEVQRLGAKHAQLGHLVTQKEAEVERLEQQQRQSRKAMETLEKTTLPPLQRELATLEKEMERLREEIGTDLVEELSDADRQLLAELKEEQSKLEASIQQQSEEVSKLGLERQKLQSFLHDNLYKRRRELMEGSKGVRSTDDDTDGRPSFGGPSSIAQKQQELAELERELDDAKRQKETAQSLYDKARANDEKLQEEEAKARNDLENLRGEDLKYSKKFEEAQERSERLLNKVRRWLVLSMESLT